jgi:hypothetical protein
MPEQQAIQTLTGAGLSVAATCSSMQSPIVSENPPGNSVVNPGSAVAIACAA